MDEGVLESIPDRYCKGNWPEYCQHYEEECPYGVNRERRGLEKHFQQFTKEILNCFLHLIHTSFDIHPGSGTNLRHAQFINLPVKFGIIDKIGGRGVFHHLLVFQPVFLLPVLLHIQCLPFEHRGGALNYRRHYRVDCAENDRREEHYTESYGKRTQKREHVHRFGS